jgi:uncharacterized membrane protein YeiB
MRPETEKKLKKIKRISKFLRAICKVLLALVTCGFLVAMVAILGGQGTLTFDDSHTLQMHDLLHAHAGGGTLTSSDDSAHVPIRLASLMAPARLLLAVSVALMMAVNFKVLYHLHRLFSNYGRGEIFTTESVSQIRQLGITALLWAGVTFLWCFTSIALTQSHFPSSVQVHSDSLAIGAVIIVISWFMEMAAEMCEENELTV